MNEAVLRAFQNFKPRPQDAWVFETPERRNFLEAQIVAFPCHALPDTENPTAICGLVHTWGVGEIWMVTGEGFARSAPVVLQQQRQIITAFYSALRLHRLCMAIDAGNAEAKLWAGRLGFEYETTLKRASPDGGDHEIYLWPHNEGGNQ